MLAKGWKNRMPALKRCFLALSCLLGLMLLSACGMPEGLNALLETPAEAAGTGPRPIPRPPPARRKAPKAFCVWICGWTPRR